MLTGLLWMLMIASSCSAQTNNALFHLDSSTIVPPQDFTIELRIRKLNEDNFQLVSTIDLAEGAYIISPSSQDDFYLHYSSTVSQNTFIQAHSEIIEFPESQLEMDSLIEKHVRFVRTKTVFTQVYDILEKNDFIIEGLIEFLVEPSCIPYDLSFEIKSQSGILSVENEKVFISAEYKR